MSQNISVKFSVSGDLAAYFDAIQKKADTLSNTTIRSANEQSTKGKEQVKIINEQIAALERKNKVEAEAARVAIKNNTTTQIGEINTKRNKNIEFLESKRGKEGYSDEYINPRVEQSNKQADESISKIKADERESLKTLKDQERQGKIQTQLAKENINKIEETAQKNVKAIQAGDLKLSDVIKSTSTDEQRLSARLTEEEIRNEKKKTGKEEIERGDGGSLFNSILRAENFNKALDFGSRAAQSKSGYDMIGNTFGAAGNTIATLTDDVPILGSLTKVLAKAAEAAGAFLERKAIAGQDFYKEAFRYSAITGSDAAGNSDMQNAGVNVKDFIRSRGEYARRRGYSDSSNDTARDAIYAEKAVGVDQGTSAALVEMQRSGRENNRDLAGLISGIIEKGQGNIFKNGDTTFLNELLGKFSTLQKELLKSQTNVPTGTTMDILGRFNKVGGEFDLRDPRSMGNINAIQSGLANPSSDNMKALAFRILSKQNPNMGVFDLNEQMSQGLGSPGYLKGVLEMVDQIGGGDQTKMMNLSGAFKGLSPSAVRRLFNNREGLMSGSISVDELEAKFPTDFKGMAERNTTPMEKNAATIETQLLNGVMKSLDAIKDSTMDAIVDAFSGAVININSGAGTIEFKRPNGAIKNPTKKDKEKPAFYNNWQ